MFKLVLAAFILVNLGLINAIQSESDAPSETKDVKSTVVCEICTLVLGAAQKQLEQNKTDDEVLSFIEKSLCSKLGALNATCYQYVQQYGKVILYELAQKIDPSIVCNHLGLCETMKLNQHPVLKPLTNSLNCTLCKVVFQQVVNLLQSNATEQQIIRYIENSLCNATGKFSQTCKTILDNYGPIILSYLAKGVDPQKLCELIGMCTAQKSVETKPVDVKPVVDDKPVNKIPMQEIKASANPLYCTVCEYAVQFLDVELKKNKTEQAIVNALDKVCVVAPASTRTQCESLINTYGIYLVELLIQFADPLKVCQAIKLCN